MLVDEITSGTNVWKEVYHGLCVDKSAEARQIYICLQSFLLILLINFWDLLFGRENWKHISVIPKEHKVP